MTLSDGSDFYLIAAKPHFLFFMCAFSKGLKDSYWHSSMVCLIQLQVSIFVCLCGLSLNRRPEKSDLISLDVCIFILGTMKRFWLSG